jgi:hypothetical protein
MKEKMTYYLSLEWIVKFVRLLTKTASNIAESVFILASLWVIFNMVAHKLTLQLLGSEKIETINQLALIAFSALPELIFVAVIEKTLSLWKSRSWLWAVLYTVPCFLFGGLAISVFQHFTSASGDVNIVLSKDEIFFRVCIGYYYAIINGMYDRLKTPDLLSEFRRLKTKIVPELEAKNDLLIGEINELKSQNTKRVPRKAASRAVSEYVNPSDYLVNQIKSGIKTIELDRLITETGISKREINRMIKDGDLKVTPRDKNKVRLSSVAEWLEIPIPISTKEEVIETILSD